jgi:hypothetical protein
MKIRSIVNITFLVLFFASQNAVAQNCKLIGNDGLKGEELTAVAVNPSKQDEILLGTNKGLYRRDSKSNLWKSVNGLSLGAQRVNQILFDPGKNEIYIAADNGLYFLNLDSGESTKLFTRSNGSEKNCSSVCVFDNGYCFVGTHSGLFMQKKKGEWARVTSPFSNQNIISLFNAGNALYAATGSGVYRSQDFGKSWEQVFNIYSYRDNVSTDISGSSPESSLSAETGVGSNSALRHMAGIKGNPGMLYIATNKGVFFTYDSGQTWVSLSLVGLDAVTLEYILVDPQTKDIFVAAKSGVYRYKNNEWQLLFAAHEPRCLAKKDDMLLLVTDRDAFECTIAAAGDNRITSEQEDIDDSFKEEPTVQEVQRMAIDYGEVSNEKIKDWRRKAAARAMLPEVSIGVDRNSSDLWHWEGGSTTKTDDDVLRRGRDAIDWGINLKWDLSEVVFDDAQTSIDTRSKLLVELRNDILSEVTRLYFERRRLQIEIQSKKEMSEKMELDKQLRISELTALLDRLTGAAFSKDLKSSP